MILIDACIWIEALQATPTGKKYLPLWDSPQEILVPTCIQYEIKRWCERFLDEEVAVRAISATRACVIVALTEKTALAAAELGRLHQLAALDAMIYAAALEHNATLVSCDSHFEGVPHVRYEKKLSA